MEPKWTLCDLLAPPEVLKKYVTKNQEPQTPENRMEWCQYVFDFNKVVKSPNKSRRIAQNNWNMANWGVKSNATHAGYVPGSDSVSFWTYSKCPDLVIKKIFKENPGVYMRFYWFNENDPIEHHYIRKPDGKMDIKRGQGVLKS